MKKMRKQPTTTSGPAANTAGQTVSGQGPQRLSQQPFVQRTPVKSSGRQLPSTTLDRAGFEQIMQAEFGVTTVTTGTQATQESIVGQPIPGWTRWEPNAAADEYQPIVDAFRDFRRVFSATPVTKEITFYEKRYEVVNGVVTPDPSTGAQFGVTDLTIYKTATTMPVPLPLDRSNAQGVYGQPPPMSLGMGYGGSKKAAPLIFPGTHAGNYKRAVVHELGHGLASAAMNLPNPASAIDPQMMNDYMKAVGWTQYVPAANNQPAVPPQLYDIGVKAVQQAIAGGTAPSAQYRITKADWNDPTWVEQPVSSYSLEGPGEDFAEAVMAYVYDPAVLKKRSPARFAFIDQRRQTWLPRMFNVPKPKPNPFQLPGPVPGASEYNDAPDIPDFRHYA